MSENLRTKLRRNAPWIALPIIAALAFGLGTCLGGNGDGAAEEHDQAAGSEGEDTVWTCSMHPQIRQPEPGQCPICGMDLIPASETGGAQQDPDPARITLSERAKVLARIQTAEVKRLDDAATEQRLLGRVEYDETTLRTVTAWTGGRIDRLHVQVTGQKVRRGQVIATLYSPEVYQAHVDLLSAKQQGTQAGEQGTTVRATAKAALGAVRQRLRLLGVPEGTIESMEEADGPWRHIPIRTPFGGTVVERLATEGQYVQTGQGLYRIADLDQLWVQLDAYESDLPYLSVGQKVKLDVKGLPGKELEGKVAFVDPTIDPRKRTARVRIEVRNRDGKLLPGMFAEAVVKADVQEVGERPLVIPASAPLFTGRRSVVYVEVPGTDQPTYEARVVKLGPKMGTVYPVIAGLDAGERVVEHGAFTLDADLQIRGGLSMMTVPDDTQHGPYDEIVEVDPEARKALGERLAPYLDLQRALANDDLAGAKEAAKELAAGAATFEPEDAPKARQAWAPISKPLAEHAHHVAHAEDLAGARAGFEALSEQMVRVLRVFGNPFDRPLRLAHCPMAFDNQGAEWLQIEDDIQNVYFGEQMLTCGEIRATVQPGDYLPAAPVRQGQGAPAGGHQH